MGVTLSHPDKALWPDGGDGTPVTKLDLARYYEAVGAWMMPHIKGRPCSIIRTPDGIGGERVLPAPRRQGLLGPDHRGRRCSGDHKPYLQIDRIEALAAAGPDRRASELHPWNCQPGQPEVPGRLVFDLDPAPDVAFDAVIEARAEVQDAAGGAGPGRLLQDHRRQGPARGHAAEGGKGKLDWPTAKAFAQRRLRGAWPPTSPDRYLVNMAKAKRGRADLPRLPAQRPHVDGGGAAVAPRAGRARRCPCR